MLRQSAAILMSLSLGCGAAVAQSEVAAQTFITDQPVDVYRATKVTGVDVYGSDNQKIGDIKDVLLDGSGQAKAVVIGVGGFLGIGEKNVAVPFGALRWVNARPPAPPAASTSVGLVSGIGGAAPMPGTEATGSTASPVASRSPAEVAAYNGYPDHAVVSMSKADLQNAPSFKYYAETHSAMEKPAPRP